MTDGDTWSPSMQSYKWERGRTARGGEKNRKQSREKINSNLSVGASLAGAHPGSYAGRLFGDTYDVGFGNVRVAVNKSVEVFLLVRNFTPTVGAVCGNTYKIKLPT